MTKLVKTPSAPIFMLAVNELQKKGEVFYQFFLLFLGKQSLFCARFPYLCDPPPKGGHCLKRPEKSPPCGGTPQGCNLMLNSKCLRLKQTPAPRNVSR